MKYLRYFLSVLTMLLLTHSISAQNGGNALTFDGTDDYVKVDAGVGSGLNFGGASQFTASFWVYPNDPGSVVNQYLFHKHFSAIGAVQYSIWLNTGKINCRIDRFSDGGNYFLTGPSAIITQSKWYYITLVKTATTFEIYVDGVFYNSGTIPVTQLGASASTGNVLFGRDNDATFPLDGKMDEIKVWNGARSATQIRQDMYRIENSSTTNLTLYLPLDEGTGQSPTDNGNAPANTVTLGPTSGVDVQDPTWVVSGATAGPGQAIKFDGLDEFGQTSAPHPVLNATDLSIEFWLRHTGGGSEQVVLSQGTASNNQQLTVGFKSSIDVNPNAFFMSFFGNELVSPGGLLDVNWHHYAATYNRTTGERKLYKDGFVIAEDISPATLNSSGTMYLASLDGTQKFVNAYMDELRIWTSVRTEAQILENVNGSVDSDESGLYVNYRFDQTPDASQTNLFDFTSNGFNMALSNMEGDLDFSLQDTYNQWVGGVSSDISNALNWGGLSVPSVTSSVGFNAISSLANLPSLTGAMGWFNATITNPGITTTTSMNVAGNLLGTTLPLDLSGTNVFMGQFGKLVESGSGILSNGTIMTSSLLNAPNAVNVGNFGLTITSAANLGPTLVQRTHFAWPLGAATGIKRFFRANPASNSGLNATLVFHYDETELNGNLESNLKLLKSSDNGVSWRYVPFIHNTVNNTFTITGQDTLEMYTAFGYVAPIILPMTPTLNQPLVSLTPTISWVMGGGMPAFSYAVEIYSDAGLTNLVHTSPAFTGLPTYNVPAAVLEYNTRYYWRAAVTDAAGVVNYSTTSVFTTLLDTPVLVSPATEYESLVMSPNLEFSINPSTSNVLYNLLIGTAPGLTVGGNTNMTTAVNPGSFIVNPVGLAIATKYWWTINAQVSDVLAHNNGENKTATAEWTFYTPLDILTTPINGVTGHTLEPSFAWDDVAWETGYELRISTAGGTQIAFNNGVFFTDLNIAPNTTSVMYNENTEDELTPGTFPFPLSPNTTYYWQLVGKDGAVDIESPIWHFTTYPAVAVSQYNPANGDSVFLNSVMFTYGINQATNGLKFKLQVKSATTPPVRTDWLTSNFTGTSTNLFQTVNLLGGMRYYWRVVLLNNANQVMSYSPTQYFSTSGGATIPTPSWPIGSVRVYTNTPQLNWYTAGYSPDITFDVEVRIGSSGGAVVYSSTNITNIYHQIATPLTAATYHYWKVRSVYKRGTGDEQTSDWSPFQIFQPWGGGQLVTPQLSYPVNNATVYTTAPFVHWWLGEAGTGLDFYVRVSSTSNFATYTDFNAGTNLFVQLSGLTPGTTYYYQVIAQNGLLQTTASSLGIFTVAGGVANGYPVLNWPTGNPTVYTTLPSLSWYLEGSPLGITGYVVRWKIGSNSSDWNSDYTATVMVIGASNTFYNFTIPFAEGQVIYWAVAATNGSSQSAWASDHFTIYSGTTPGAPVLSWPVGNAILFTVDPQLNWWVNGSTSGIVGYEVVYSYSDVFANGATTTAYSSTTSLNVTGLVEGATYYWKVRAHFGGLSYGAFSAVESFTINPGSFAPVTPIVGGPHNVMIATTSPIISWGLPAAMTAGMKFDLEVAENVNFTNSTLFENLTTTNQPLQGLSPNKSYFWRVRTKNSDGAYSYYSGLGKFQVMDGATDIKDMALVPAEFGLDQNFPNPFNPSTTIRFALPTDVNVKLDVYNTLGEKIAEIVNGPMNAGSYSINFDASSLPSGIYFYRIEAGSSVAIRKMILLK
ncbi:MAG: T9SS type A sorting domain-containing protein [Ignavibacteriales bacterium]|nr:T9SS type A sorting domain-containing protein [Ignavibacteriales bacterium]